MSFELITTKLATKQIIIDEEIMNNFDNERNTEQFINESRPCVTSWN